MGKVRTTAMREVPLEEARFAQVLEFARKGLGLDVGPNPSKEKVYAQLVALGREAIWVADLEVVDALASDPVEVEGEPRTEPDTERWVQFTVDPETNLETGQMIDSTADCSINGRSVSLPRGVPVWCAEIFYVHLTQYCVERRMTQERSRPGEGRPGRRHSFDKQRFTVHFHKYGGVLRENPAPVGWRKGERVYGPDGHVPPEVLTSHLHQPVDARVQALA